jgi:UDP-glucose 4-epimerase
MRCLVTGVAGFIGSHLAERLIAAGHTVLGVDALTPFYPRAMKEANLCALQQSERFEFLEGDLCALDLDPLLTGRDWIFHQAGQAGVRSSWGEQFATYTACNIMATQRLLEAATRADQLTRFVYASSSSVYGAAPELPLRETTLPQPVAPYGVTKLAGEHLCRLYWHSYGVPTVALRYFTVYGPRQRPDMAFHRFGKALLAGEELRIYGDGGQTRDFTYITDIVEANLLAATSQGVEGQIFNIAGGARVSLAEALRLLVEMAGREANVRYMDSARGDMRDTYADVSAAQRMLGFTPRVGLREGLAAEVAYLRELYSVHASATAAHHSMPAAE